jgi:hypothetical protein
VRCGEIVWAKVRGYTWWPARLTSIKREPNSKTLVRVDFLDDNMHAVLAIDKVVPYKQGKESFRKTKRRRLLGAIRIADMLTSPSSKPELEGFTDNFSVSAKSFGNDTLYNTIQKEVNKEMNKKNVVKSLLVKSIKTLLKILTVKKNPKLVYNTEMDVLAALKAIQGSVNDGAIAIKDDIGNSLKVFINTYEDTNQLTGLINYAKEVLDLLKKTINKKHLDEIVKNKGSVTKKKKIETIEIEDKPIQKPQEIIYFTNPPTTNKLLLEEEKVKSVEDKSSPVVKNTALMITICQQLAKVIEEVS